ncbi:MAG: endonuclease/exonuclease/phosphatase family protein [Pirellulales bacterium]|nr:endonuclease/exonuclease/phosphatase family protein [Pirellulales bacterium]
MTASNEPATAKRGMVLRLLWLVVRGLVSVLGIATALTLLARSHWLADLCANLRVQQCLALAAALAVCLVARQWRWAVAVSFCLAIHVPWFLPAAPVETQVDAESEPLTITFANVLTRNQQHEDIVADVLRSDPDMFVILELSHSLAKTLDAHVKDSHSHSVVRPMDRSNFGIGLYSRLPLEEYEVFTLNTKIESIAAKIRVNGKVHWIFATHPLPPIGRIRYRVRNEHLQQLAAKIRETVNDPSVPTILVGDLNLTPWSPHFDSFQETSGLRRATTGFDVTPTWYRFPAFPFGLVLDHALISEEVICQAHDVGPASGSDHRSVTVTLAVARD